MKLLDYLKSILKAKKEIQTEPSGYCPNCWGRQEYGGKFYKAVKTEGINTENIEAKKGWIQAYAQKNLTGIELNKQDSKLICNNCRVAYTGKH